MSTVNVAIRRGVSAAGMGAGRRNTTEITSIERIIERTLR
jgi:hypothetical protein